MKPRDFLNFFKTKTGKLVAFIALFAAALIIFSVVRKHHPSAEDAVSVTALATNATDKPQVVQSVTRPMQALLSAAAQAGADERCRHRRRLLFRNPLRCQWFPRTKHQRSRPSVCLPTVRREFRRPKS